MQWTEEETRYLRAILTWQAKSDNKRASSRLSSLGTTEEQDGLTKKPVGNLRILVAGAEGCGKTSILTRFCLDAFRGDAGAVDSSFDGSCRRLVEIDGWTYTADVLELPGKHLSTDTMLQNALNITEGAVLVYDVTDCASLALAARIQHYIKDAVGTREYGLLLVGNKSDVGEEAGRTVPAADGKMVAASFDMECGFMEASARTGENVAAIFPTIGHEILRLRLLNREQREEAELAAMLNPKAQTGAAIRNRRGIWKTITSPFSRRRSTMPS